jgi:hypothetical protein
MKNRKYAVHRKGLTVQLPFSSALIGWKPLAVLAAVLVLLAAMFVFAAVLAIRILVFVAIVGLILYFWFRLKKLFRGDGPSGAGETSLRPSPRPTRVGGREEELPSE